MAIDFTPSWMNEDLRIFQQSVERFVEAEMLPDDEAARKRGHVGHEIWRKAGALGFCAPTFPRRTAAAAATSAMRRCSTKQTARRGLTGMSDLGAQSIVAHYLLNHGTEEQKARLPAAHGARRAGRRHRDDRAGRRLGPAGHAHPRRAARRPLRHQRQQDLHHQRLPRRASCWSSARPMRRRARAAPRS